MFQEELVDKQSSDSKIENKDVKISLDFFRGETFSNYLKSQMKTKENKENKPHFLLPITKSPLSAKNKTKRRRSKYRSKQKNLSFGQQSLDSVMKIKKQAENHPNVMKYKYGVRRGLPAGNVDGVEQLKLPEETKPLPSKKENKIEPKIGQLDREEKSHSRPVEFELNDAVTDEHRNNLLFQYIRDRKVRHIPRQRRYELRKLKQSLARKS